MNTFVISNSQFWVELDDFIKVNEGILKIASIRPDKSTIIVSKRKIRVDWFRF